MRFIDCNHDNRVVICRIGTDCMDRSVSGSSSKYQATGIGFVVRVVFDDVALPVSVNQ